MPIRLFLSLALSASALLLAGHTHAPSPVASEQFRGSRFPASVVPPDGRPLAPRLSPGEALRITPGGPVDLHLSAPQANYILAYADTRPLTRAMGRSAALDGFQVQLSTGPELTVPRRPRLARTANTVEPRAHLARDWTADEAPAPVRVELTSPQASASDCMDRGGALGCWGSVATHRDTWQPGDRLAVPGTQSHFGADRGASDTARVIGVYADRYVVALFEPHARVPDPSDAARVDSAMHLFLDHGEPLLSAALSQQPPSSNPHNDQLLILLRGDMNRHGVTTHQLLRRWAPWPRVQGLAWIELSLPDLTTTADLLSTLTHEMTHAWGLAYRRDQAEWYSKLPGPPPHWASEGAADLVAGEVLRRHLGVGLQANWDWSGVGRRSVWGRAYGEEPAHATGELTTGYGHASSFLRDLLVRAVRDGSATPGSPLRSLLRGALEGWWGQRVPGTPGLAGRMRARFGGTWRPADALLAWTTRQAADENPHNSDWQNHAFRAVGGSSGGWKPDAHLATASGQAAYRRRRAGSTGYFRLVDWTGDSHVRLQASVPGVEWLLFRAR